MTAQPATSTREHGSPIAFLACAAGVMVGVAVFWGQRPLTIPLADVAVPSAVLLAFVPTVLALAFSAAEGGRRGMVRLLARMRPTRRIGLRWYALSALVNPAIQLVAYALAVGLGRQYDWYTPLSTLVVILPALLLAAAEEVGWTGYATGSLQHRWGPLGAALTLGVVDVVIHIVPYLQADHGAAWIVGQAAVILGGRIVRVWVFNHTAGSILPAILLHATYNVAYIMYPYQGSHYDPLILGAVLWVFVAIAPLRWMLRTVSGRSRRRTVIV